MKQHRIDSMQALADACGDMESAADQMRDLAVAVAAAQDDEERDEAMAEFEAEAFTYADDIETQANNIKASYREVTR